MKKINHFYLVAIVLLLNSCGVYNRMTSPETLKKEQRNLTFGVALSPPKLVNSSTENYETPIDGIQPVIGYRSGLGKNQDIGVTLYGIYTPALVIDYKHQILKNNNFLLSGDAAIYGGYLRPVGVQYDLIFGKRQIYGVIGASYDMVELMSEKPFLSLGIGSERIANTGFGIQISYAKSFMKNDYIMDEPYLISIGLKFDFLRTKKKFRK